MANVATDHYARIALDQIIVPPDRQRSQVNVDDLIPSIRDRGVVQPIIVTRELELVAGERRFRASQELGLPDIPVRFLDELPPVDRKIVELEENLKRRDLTWQDEARGILSIHKLYLEKNPGWTSAETAEILSIDRPRVTQACQVAAELEKGNPKVETASSIRSAYDVISRRMTRQLEDALVDFATATTPAPPTKPGETVKVPKPVGPRIIPAEESIFNVDFRVFAKIYEGPPFNLIHCDFPYGVGIDESAQAKTETRGSYSDSDDDYWELCQALAANASRLFATSAHLIFWTSADPLRIADTLAFFEDELPSVSFWRAPLIWHKTDNRGIVADAQRGPRHVYETALFGQVGDRKIVKVVSDVYGAPSDKTFHHSTKPEPMLRHFFEMLVDDTTRMLDPTCGSGSAIRAAESLGAKSVLGLELNQEYCDGARQALRKFRTLRNYSK
jgi:ParB/RepB/Spo0J family partition protein